MPQTSSYSTSSTGFCRTERRETTWGFAGYVPPHEHDGPVKPAPFYQRCGTCTLTVLTLGGPRDLPDALGLCMAVLVEFKRRRARASGAAVTAEDEWFDEGNVLGDLQAYVWQLYERWNPNYHTVRKGNGNNFRGYAVAILRQKVKTFVARDTGVVAGGRKIPKAHSHVVSDSYEALTESGSLNISTDTDATVNQVAARERLREVVV